MAYLAADNKKMITQPNGLEPNKTTGVFIKKTRP